jgi:septal ring factor EnvC (AmiA/AmiB activator)
MAGTAKSIIDIVIKATTSAFSGGMKGAEESVKTFSSKTVSALHIAQGAFSGLAKNISGAFTGIKNNYMNLRFAVLDIANQFNKLAGAWIEKEKTLSRLNGTIARSGQNLKESRKAIDKYTASIKAMGIPTAGVLDTIQRLIDVGYT